MTSILSNPDQDPHLFEASPETARALSDAKVVIVNGVDYDPWMEKLLAAQKAPGRKEIVVGELVGRKTGDNPHLWYDPANMKAAGKAIVGDARRRRPARTRPTMRQGEAQFLDSLKPIDAKIADMRKRYAGHSRHRFGAGVRLSGGADRAQGAQEKFALAVMNNAEPSASDVAGFENDFKATR